MCKRRMDLNWSDSSPWSGYSLRTRSEALSFHTALAHKSFSLHANETSPSTVVTDTIRKIDYENARYSKLLGILASSIDATGLQVAEADMVAVLLRSLPEGKGDGKGVIEGKGKTKGKSKGKARGKGFGKKGKMNELGYGDETGGMDEWCQDDGSWWTDQTWLQTAQVWNETWTHWDNGWTADWTDQQGQWAQDWTWDSGQEAQVEYASSSQQPESHGGWSSV
eukprot:s3884_g5.t1